MLLVYISNLCIIMHYVSDIANMKSAESIGVNLILFKKDNTLYNYHIFYLMCIYLILLRLY